MTTDRLKPDPTAIGGIAAAPLARLPDPVALFGARAGRFRFLARQVPNLGPYLAFLGDLAAVQADLAAALGAAPAGGRPPVSLAEGLDDVIVQFCARLAGVAMPDPAAAALAGLAEAGPDRRVALALALGEDPPDPPAADLAPMVLAGAALQVHAARRAAALDAQALVRRDRALCPACGGRPGVSLVTAALGPEGARYCACATCQTLWNEVRVKCLCCGGTGGVAYRSVETDEAAIKAETCRDCGRWVKILYQTRNPSLEAVADDVASLGLDLMMAGTEWRRAGVNPFLAGYR